MVKVEVETTKHLRARCRPAARGLTECKQCLQEDGVKVDTVKFGVVGEQEEVGGHLLAKEFAEREEFVFDGNLDLLNKAALLVFAKTRRVANLKRVGTLNKSGRYI